MIKKIIPTIVTTLVIGVLLNGMFACIITPSPINRDQIGKYEAISILLFAIECLVVLFIALYLLGKDLYNRVKEYLE